MANFFKKINKTSQETVQKVKDSTEISRFNTQIQAEQKEQEKLFVQIGRHYFNQMKENGGEDLEATFIPLFDAVNQAEEKISAYQAEILKIKNVKRCHKCGRECSQDSVFCAGCGTQLPQEEKEIKDNHCVKCGAELAPDDAFCFNCGSRIEK